MKFENGTLCIHTYNIVLFWACVLFILAFFFVYAFIANVCIYTILCVVCLCVCACVWVFVNLSTARLNVCIAFHLCMYSTWVCNRENFRTQYTILCVFCWTSTAKKKETPIEWVQASWKFSEECTMCHTDTLTSRRSLSCSLIRVPGSYL